MLTHNGNQALRVLTNKLCQLILRSYRTVKIPYNITSCTYTSFYRSETYLKDLLKHFRNII